MSSSNNTCVCPVCDREFTDKAIQDHVNKCLFLNSEKEDKSSTKRLSDQNSSLRIKKPKVTYLQPSSSRVMEEELVQHYQSESKLHIHQDIDNNVPLAEKMRPKDLTTFIGQGHILGPSKGLRSLLERGNVPNMILWGPPGCGKTSLAHIIDNQCRSNSSKYRFVKLSATIDGIDKVKEVVKIAKNELSSFKRQTLLFVDEIHRFNKLQQDFFLPFVERGIITLIGATTENPSFSLNNALLSRCSVYVLEKLLTEDVMQIVKRALDYVGIAVTTPGQDFDKSMNSKPWAVLDTDCVRWMAEMCDGDARISLNSVQLAYTLLQQKREAESSCGAVSLSLAQIKECIKRSHILYDRKGDEHYSIISALHKSIRASDGNAALYWLTRMLAGGEDPSFIARRLVRAASEDIGLADSAALPLAVSTMQGCKLLGMPESGVLLAQCAIYLARAPKSTEVYKALGRAKATIEGHKGAQPSVPLHLRNAPTGLMKNLGYGKGYNTAPKGSSNLEYMPEGLEHANFFL